MKTLKVLAAVCLLTVSAFATEVTEADKKWGGAVEKMIQEGATTVSTPSEARVSVAKELAKRLRRDCQVTKTGDTYKIVFSSAKLAKN